MGGFIYNSTFNGNDINVNVKSQILFLSFQYSNISLVNVLYSNEEDIMGRFIAVQVGNMFLNNSNIKGSLYNTFYVNYAYLIYL